MRIPRGAREAATALIVAALALVLLGAFEAGDTLRSLETETLDLRFKVRGVQAPGPDVVLVLIDDPSLAALGRWPLSRRTIVRALDALQRAGARTVVFDLLFAEPEDAVPSDLRAAARAAAEAATLDPSLRGSLRALADDDPDGELEAALRRAGSVLLPIAFAFQGPPQAVPDYLPDLAYAQFDKSATTPAFPLTPVSALLPIERLSRAALGLGVATIAFDRDGAPRYDYLAWRFEGDFFPSLPVRAAAAYRGVPLEAIGLAAGEGVRIGETVIPTNPAMRMLINYRGPRGTFRPLSFLDLVEGRIDPAALRGRLVVVGASILGLSDSYPAPFDNTPMPGAERIANAIDTILRGDMIAELSPAGVLITGAAVLVLALATGMAGALLPTRLAVLAGVLPLAGWCVAAQVAFAGGLWLPVIKPLGALGAAVLSVLLYRYLVVDREGRQVRSAFRQYLSPALVNQLAAHPERLKLGGETRTMTLLFCDVRGFTAISERFKADPHGLTQLINRFLTPMTDIILARGGTIDKYMGDCIMAFWNAPIDDPEHADHACASALAMVAGLDALNRRLAGELGQTEPLRVGIGLNTGACVVGNMGSEQRFDYSVLGDAVNLASRLEGQSKTYGVDIVIGEATRDAAPGWAALELDRIAVKGKREAVRIYTLRGDAAHAETPGFQALATRHAAMLDAYRRQDWDAALAALDDCALAAPGLSALYDLYRGRLLQFQAHPPAPDWDGVFVAMEK